MCRSGVDNKQKNLVPVFSASWPGGPTGKAPLNRYFSEILRLSGKLYHSADQIFHWYDHLSNAKADANVVPKVLSPSTVFVSLSSKRRLLLWTVAISTSGSEMRPWCSRDAHALSMNHNTLVMTDWIIRKKVISWGKFKTQVLDDL